MTQLLTPSGPSYRLTVRAEDGRLARYAAPTALLRRGHSTLFGWILTWAPQTELDTGIAPHPADPARAGRPALRRRHRRRASARPRNRVGSADRRTTQSRAVTDQNSEPDRADPEPAEAAQVSRLLAGAPAPPMPPDVAARLDAVLAQESRPPDRPRAGGPAGTRRGLVDRGTKPFLLSPDTRPPAWRRAAGVVLVAAVSAAAVGAAGYTLSAVGRTERAERGRPLPGAELGAGRPGPRDRQYAGPERPHLLGSLAVRPYGHVGPDHRLDPGQRGRDSRPAGLHPGPRRELGHGGDRLPPARCVGPRVGAAARLTRPSSLA